MALVLAACSTASAPVSSAGWSRVPDIEEVFGGVESQQMLSVTAAGPGLVAVGVAESAGDEDAAVWTSPDGISWSRVRHDEKVFGGAENQVMLSVTAAGPGVVAVGSDQSSGDLDAAVWTSPDGITWSRLPLDEDSVLAGSGSQLMFSVTAGGPGLVAVGSDGPLGDADAAVWTSADGMGWSRVRHDEAVFGGENFQAMVSVTTGGPGLVAVGLELSDDGQDAAVWTSPDGIAWSRVGHDEAVFGGPRSQLMSSVTTGGPGLVAVGRDVSDDSQDAAVWTSPDGLIWSRVSRNEAAALGGEGRQEMVSVTAGGPGLVAVGWEQLGDLDAVVWTSRDGRTWSRVPDSEAVFGGEGFQTMGSVTTAGPGLVAVGQDESGRDRDAAVWVAARED